MRFIIVNMQTKDIIGKAETEAEAQTIATEQAQNSAKVTFCVYQIVGSASLDPRVIWKAGE